MILGRMKIINDRITQFEKVRMEMDGWKRPDDQALKLCLRGMKYVTTMVMNNLIRVRAGIVSGALPDECAEDVLKVADIVMSTLPLQIGGYLKNLKRHLDLKAVYVDKKFG